MYLNRSDLKQKTNSAGSCQILEYSFFSLLLFISGRRPLRWSRPENAATTELCCSAKTKTQVRMMAVNVLKGKFRILGNARLLSYLELYEKIRHINLLSLCLRR